MSKFKSREVLGFSKNILRNGTHFSSLSLKVPVTVAEAVNGRKIIKAGTIVGKDGTKKNTADAYAIVYEDIDCTYEQTSHIYVPVLVHAIIEEARLPIAPSAEAKAALTGIIFEAGPTKKADDFSELEK